jgi:hypothetical protein
LSFSGDTLNLDTNLTGLGTISSGAITSSGVVSAEDDIYLTDAGTVRGKLLLNASDRDNVELRAESLGSTMKFFTGGTQALFLDASQNATFAGTISSGAITSSGAVKAYGNSDTVSALEIYSDSNHGMRILHRGTDGAFSFERRVSGTNTEFLRIGRGTGNATFAGTISSGAITSSGNLVLDAVGHNYIELHSSTGNTRKWRFYNGQSWNADALLIYDQDADSTALTIETGKLGINRGGGSLSHTLDVGGNVAITGTEIISSSRNFTNIGTISSGAITATGDISANGLEVGTVYGSDSQYLGIKRAAASSNDYILIQGSGSDVGNTYLSAGSGKSVHIRANANNVTNQLIVSSSGTTIGGNTVWHAGNDGSGSGLDADTVDGKHKDFLMHYKGIVSGNWDTIFSQTAGHMGVYQVENISNTDSNYPSGAYTYGGVMSWQLANSTFKLYAPHTGQLHYQTGWNNDEYSGWRKIWDTGNDGSGSGLDADLLDGSHKVDIQKQLVNVQSVTAADSCLPSTGYGFKHFLGLGPSNNDGHILGMTWAGTTAYGAQIYVDTDPNNIMAFRSRSSTGVWTSWNTVWHTGNDGSGSGLDADLLDGQQGSYYNQSQFTGSAFISRNISNPIAIDSVTTNMVGYVTGSSAAGYSDGAGFSAAYNSSWVGQLFVDFRTGKLSTRGKNNGTWQAHRFMWDNLNDGSGSGLDADLLDGQHGSYYMPASTTTIAQSHYVSGNGFSTNGPDSVLEYAQWSSQTDTKFAPSGDWYNSIRMGHGDPYSYYSNTMAMKMTGSGSGTLYTQVISNNSAGGWNKYWHTNNDGSGSGLDADTVDGVQASSMVQLTGNPVITGQKYFQSNRNTTSNSPALQAYSTGGTGAIMSFHRSGVFAINMGLDSDNIFRIGGWSASANRLTMDMSGNLTMAGNVTAYSDIRLKENIKVIPDALSKVQQIRGVTFTRNDAEDLEKLHTGVIAQEVETVLPEAVSEDNIGIKNVAYGNMIGLLIESIKELKAEVDDLKTQLENK